MRIRSVSWLLLALFLGFSTVMFGGVSGAARHERNHWMEMWQRANVIANMPLAPNQMTYDNLNSKDQARHSEDTFFQLAQNCDAEAWLLAFLAVVSAITTFVAGRKALSRSGSA